MRKLTSVLLFGTMLAVAGPLFAQGTSDRNTSGTKPSGKQDLISRADTNGDGKVSRDEFEAYERAKADKIFDKLDKNKDGFIEKSELASAKRRRHK